MPRGVGVLALGEREDRPAGARGELLRGARIARAGRQAVAALESGRAPLELARALVARGALQRRRGTRNSARADLQRAHDLAARRAAVRVAEAAATELGSSGARLRRSTAGGADALTPSERRVAELAVDGLSNRDIAQSLFLSEKTVEAHLGRAYRKLGIRSRVRLAAALGGGERGHSGRTH